MNFIKLLEELSNKELLNEKSSRRGSFQQFKKYGKNAALASIPFAMAATSNTTKAAAASMASATFQASPVEVLNFALYLEYLERNFYQMAIDTNGLIPSEDQNIFSTIADHEAAHVDFLVAGISNAGGNPIAEPNFDFTLGGSLDTFENYQTFLALAQGFEDTGVRAYKGQAGALANNNDLLTYALQIHSIEARHASQVRRMRGQKGWITQNDQSLPDNFQAIYEGQTPESNTVQGGVELAGMFSEYGGNDAITEAFDEPLTMDEVNTIATMFEEG